MDLKIEHKMCKTYGFPVSRLGFGKLNLVGDQIIDCVGS